jgi:iron complex outermembrane receptor protein
MKKILFLILMILPFFSSGQNEYKLTKDTIKLNEISISAFSPYQANVLMPITFTNINKIDLGIKNYGQEPSRILQTTPSITTYSESGGDWGYSYIRIRGIDQTRINTTLNGVPLNEPEDQGCYFSNYPDFFQSLDNVQIQRGTGMTKNGTSSFVGSINFDSYKPKTSNLNMNAYIGFGSWNTSKISLNGEYGWKNGGLYGSVSDIESEGYKDHSGNHSRSFFLISNQTFGKNQFKFVEFAGSQYNQLAWLGAPMDSINKNRKYNACTTKEKDEFSQYHLQFHHTYNINPKSRIGYTLYYNYLTGGYKYDGAHIGLTDVYGYNLFSNFYGCNVNYFIKLGPLNFYTGVNGYKYNRRHYGTTNDIHQYTNTGYRNDASVFVKGILNDGDMNFYADLQYRYTDFSYNGDISYDTLYAPHTGVMFPTKYWNFFNFSGGVEYKINHNILYYSIGKNNREPIRNDMFYGNDYLPCDIYGNPFYLNLSPESVLDQEFGYRYIFGNFNMNINLYYMDFTNEMVLTGTMGNTGLPLKINAPKSYRRGFEFDANYKWKFGLSLSQNLSYNNSQITWDNQNTTVPVLTPEWLSNTEISYNYKWFVVGASCRYQNQSYIDKDNKYTIPNFYTLNTKVGLKWRFIEWDLYLNNITNQNYLPNGMVDNYGTPLYFVGAPFNFFTGIKIKM